MFELDAAALAVGDVPGNVAGKRGGSAQDGAPDAFSVLTRLAARRRPLCLDSAAGFPRRFGLVAFDPLAGQPPQTTRELRAWAERLEPGATESVPGPFHGGFAGALAYDLGVHGEAQELPPEPWGFPLVVGGLYTDFVVIDLERRRAWLVLGEDPGDDRPSVAERRAELCELLAAPWPQAGGRSERAASGLGPLVRHTPPAVHRERIERVRAAIARGDFYQANLAHRFTRKTASDPLELYGALRAANPAPFMGFCRFDGEQEGALLCSSPELLLELVTAEDGRRSARTRPIKGTLARADDPKEDLLCAERLLASAKDRAELAMIVDLERNDLGRTAKPGSVRVEAFPALRSYARVHHLTADVVAEPRDECDAWDVLDAIFPGGSVTGAPKLASMRAIAELEGEGRGFFCGALGFVDTRGHALWNVLIRTLLWRPCADGGGEVSFRVGGGITFASDPAAEEEETLAKASALFSAFESAPAGARGAP